MPRNDLWDYCHKYIGASDTEAHHRKQFGKARSDKEDAERQILNIMRANDVTVARIDHCRIVRLVGGVVSIEEITDAIGLSMPEPTNGKRYRDVPEEPAPIDGWPVLRTPREASHAIDAALAQPTDAEIDEAAAYAALADGEVS